MCARFPEKAREIRTGALNTVQAGQVVWIESTAEGQEGHFYDICNAGQSKQRLGTPLTPLDFKFFFFPWWKAPEYTIDPTGVVIDEGHRKYFQALKDTAGIDLSAAQQAWYVKKAETQLGDGINSVRAILPACQFDAGPCAEGLKVLKAYRKEWDEERGCWKDQPRHDWASHGSDAFRILGCAYRDFIPSKPKPKEKPRWAGRHIKGAVLIEMTIEPNVAEGYWGQVEELTPASMPIARALICAAGACATLWVSDTMSECENDFEQMDEKIRVHLLREGKEPSDEDVSETRRVMLSLVAKKMTEYRPHVEKLAAELYCRRTMTGDEVRAVLPAG